MVIIERHPFLEGCIFCSFKYSLYYVERIRTIPTARYDATYKAWLCHEMVIPNLEAVFNGEIFYKTPRWLLLGEPKPDYSSLYALPPITLPPLLLPLYPYQDYGARFMVNALLTKGYALDCDDVGLGKTPTAIATFNHMRQYYGVRKCLVLAKRSLKTQWNTDAFQKFLGEECMVIGGTPKQRLKQYEEYINNPLGSMVVSYHTLLNDRNILKKIHFDMAICDEAHLFKNRTGKINGAVEMILKKIKYKIGLTGTPLAKEPEDGFGILKCFDDKLFGSYNKFSDTFLVKEDSKFKKAEVIGFKNIDKFRAILHGIMIRRTEFEVDVELPEVVMSTVSCLLDPVQIKINELISFETNKLDLKLNALRCKVSKTTQDFETITQVEASLKGLIASRQACADDPRLFALSKSKAIAQKYGPLVPKDYKSDKTDKILEKIDEVVSSGHKVIVFTKFERMASLLKQDIISSLKYKTASYTGTENDKEREENIAAFKFDPDCPILVATDAANEGLNLQMAKYVFHVDQPDLPAIKVQRNGRVRRVSSQFQHVYCYDFITEGSYDNNRVENLKALSNSIDAFVGMDSAQSEALVAAMNK